MSSSVDAPLGWLCEDLWFKGEFDFTKNPQRAAQRAETPDQWRVIPVYAKENPVVPKSPDTSFRHPIEAALIAIRDGQEGDPVRIAAKALLRRNAVEIAEALMAALDQPEIMAESVEGFADRMAKTHGDPNGSDYDQGQHDMAQRFKSRLFMKAEDLRLVDPKAVATEAVEDVLNAARTSLEEGGMIRSEPSAKSREAGLKEAARMARAEGDAVEDGDVNTFSRGHVSGRFYALANTLRAMSNGYVPPTEEETSC